MAEDAGSGQPPSSPNRSPLAFMPLTPFQKEVLSLLAANRTPKSYVAGGTAINRNDASPRYSLDVDLFHDDAQSVALSSAADVRLLTAQGFLVEWLLRQPSHQRAKISRAGDELRLDWCCESAFRFFPVQPDPAFGYCLHPADLATNKMLALAGRSEIRDFLDALFLHENCLSLGALCWAACGKDEGFTPWSLMDHAKRNVKFRQDELESEHMVKPLRLPELKETWLKAVAQAEEWFAKLPSADVGCLYLDAGGAPYTPDPADAQFPQIKRHFGSLLGAWPNPA